MLISVYSVIKKLKRFHMDIKIVYVAVLTFFFFLNFAEGAQ